MSCDHTGVSPALDGEMLTGWAGTEELSIPVSCPSCPPATRPCARSATGRGASTSGGDSGIQIMGDAACTNDEAGFNTTIDRIMAMQNGTVTQ